MTVLVVGGLIVTLMALDNWRRRHNRQIEVRALLLRAPFLRCQVCGAVRRRRGATIDYVAGHPSFDCRALSHVWRED